MKRKSCVKSPIYLYDEIYITRHAKDRFLQRIMTHTEVPYNGNVCKTILSLIRHSRVITIAKGEGNQILEYRETEGVVFVCSIILSTNFFVKSQATVLTVIPSGSKIKEYLFNGIDLGDMDMRIKLI